MKHPSIVVALIVSIALVIATSMISSAIVSFGKSLERAAAVSRPSSQSIPSNFRIGFEGGNTPIRIDMEETLNQ